VTDLVSRSWGAIHEALKSRGYEFVETRQGITRYRGSISSGKTTVAVQIEIEDPLFTAPPKVLIEDPGVRRLIRAHLMSDGSLCYAEAGVEEYDLYDAGGAVLRVLESARSTLNEVLHSSTTSDLQREFVAYWAPKTYLFSDLPAGFEGAARGRVWDPPAGPFLIVTTPDRIPLWGGKTKETHPVWVVRATRPLDTSKGAGPGSTLASLRLWLGEFIDEAGALDRALAPALIDQGRLVVLAENGSISAAFTWPHLDAQAFKKAPEIRRSRYIANNESQMTMAKALVDSVALPDLVNARLEAASPLIGLSIAVVGTGAIGSRVCMELARCGAGQAEKPMTLIDHEIFVAANFGRHTLPISAVRSPKATALVDEIKRLHPDLNVAAIPSNVFEVLGRLSDFDLIVDATGSNPAALRLNEEATSRRQAGETFPPILHAAIHGNGAAVQTILVTDPKHACLKCLRPSHGLYKANPLKPGVKVAFESASCGDGAHIRYAASAPMMAAAVTLQAVLDWASNPADPGPRVRTRALDLANTNPPKDRNWGAEPGCPACDRSVVD
jgi:hypothetical protein